MRKNFKKFRKSKLEKEKFENYLKAIKGFVKTSVIEMTSGETVDLFPTDENIFARAQEKFARLKKCGFYDNLNRLNLKVCERV